MPPTLASSPGTVVEQLEALLGSSSMAVAFLDRELRYERVSPAFAALNGLPADEVIGRRPSELHPAVGAVFERLLTRVIRRNAGVAGYEMRGELATDPGRARSWEVDAFPVRSDGEIVGVGVVGAETTARREAERTLQRREREARFLAEAANLLNASLDYETTLQNVAHLAAPAIADCCVVDLLDGSGSIRRVAVAHGDRSSEPLSWELAERWPTRLDEPAGIAEVARTGRARVVTEIPDERLAAVAADSDQLAIFRALGLRSWMMVPLRARGRTLGVMSLAAAESGRRFGARDLELAETLADRCALAIDNARLYARQHGIAEALQRSLLPAGLPAVEGVELAARYRAAGSDEHVGGDWYDVIALPDGRLGLVVGDVVGRGVPAAAMMGQLRTAVRAFAFTGRGPAAVLDRVGAWLAHFDGDEMVATLAYAVADPGAGELCHASAGHPEPLLVAPGRAPELVRGGRSLPLGLADAPHEEVRVPLAPGATLLLYTDGLVERRGAITDGLAALAKAADGDDTGPEALCDRVLAALLPAPTQDDVTLLAARFGG